MMAVLGNAKHPEYGSATVPLPIPNDEYGHVMELLGTLGIGDVMERDCKVEEIQGGLPILKRLEKVAVNIDELDYLAKRLDSFDYIEAAQFQAMAVKTGIFDMKDLINLTFCCQQATVITDFSNLEAIGRHHLVSINGGCLSSELADTDLRMTALKLILSKDGTVTPYGVVYGYKKCSLKHKIGTQEKFCNNYPPCQEVWARGDKVVKFIGYDAGEDYRRVNAISHDMIDTKYKKEYPLIDWGWTREDCVAAIEQEGLPLPGKSSCFFCPSMKRHEIRTLYHNHRDLFDRAIAIEDNARPNLISVKGLGRNWSWRDFVEADKNQTAMCWMFPETDMPCGCYDGE